MRTTLAALGAAAGIGFIYCQGAGAVPVNPAAVKQAATTASPVEQAQSTTHRSRRGYVKCYHALVVGPYRCHRFWF